MRALRQLTAGPNGDAAFLKAVSDRGTIVRVHTSNTQVPSGERPRSCSIYGRVTGVAWTFFLPKRKGILHGDG